MLENRQGDGNSYFWHVYKFYMPQNGLLGIYLESGSTDYFSVNDFGYSSWHRQNGLSLMIDYHKCSLYKYYDEMRIYYYNSPRKAYQSLRDAYMGAACEEYAEKHPDAPFRAELLAIFALLDAGPGSFAWDEYYQKKFSSPGEVWSSAKRKMREWLTVHKADPDVLSLLAATVRLSHGPEDNGHPEVCDYLYQALAESDRCEYGRIWVNTAWATGFSSYLSALEEEEKRYRSPRLIGKSIDGKTLLKKDTPGFYMVLLSWVAFMAGIASVCIPFIDFGAGPVLLNEHAIYKFRFDNTLAVSAAGIAALCFFTHMKNVKSQAAAVSLCKIWTAVYSIAGTACLIRQTWDWPIDLAPPFREFLKTVLILGTALGLGRDMGRNFYLVRHPPTGYTNKPYSFFDHVFIFICAGISIGNTIAPSAFFDFYQKTNAGRLLPFMPWIILAALSILRRHASDKYVIGSWYAAALAACFLSMMSILLYRDISSAGVVMFLILVMAPIITYNIGNKHEGESFNFYLPCILAIFAVYLTFEIRFQFKNVCIMPVGFGEYAVHLSSSLGTGLALYITLRECVFSIIRKTSIKHSLQTLRRS